MSNINPTIPTIMYIEVVDDNPNILKDDEVLPEEVVVLVVVIVWLTGACVGRLVGLAVGFDVWTGLGVGAAVVVVVGRRQ